jgi:hypothetical protein
VRIVAESDEALERRMQACVDFVEGPEVEAMRAALPKGMQMVVLVGEATDDGRIVWASGAEGDDLELRAAMLDELFENTCDDFNEQEKECS